MINSSLTAVKVTIYGIVVRLGEMDEISSMKEHKIPSVSLGQARLRSETAAIAASAVILEFHHARRSDV